jgi:xanthine dehydrogenase large subunit
MQRSASRRKRTRESARSTSAPFARSRRRRGADRRRHPGPNDCGPIIHDDPILADGIVQYAGQPMFAVVAETNDIARRAARLAKVDYEVLPAVLTPQEAKRQKSYVLPPMHLKRGDAGAAMATAPRKVAGEFYVGGQEQFYLEGQISYAVPKEDGCIHLYCSTQHPTEMQHVVAHALELVANQVTVEMRRMGGGFGGKESQSALFACVAAVAAHHTRRPVKIRVDRDDDFMITGKRHCFHYEYEVGYGDDGTIRAAKIEMAARAGFSADLSGPVCTRAVCHFDNAYFLPDVDILAIAGKTNTQSNTAFRGFGGPQGALAIEYILDNVARELGRDPLDVRKANFYGKSERNVTPYGMTVEDNVIGELVDELEASSDYRERRRAIDAFNASSVVLKKGIALTPGQVRHLVQRRALQPGGRAGPRLHRRLGAREPRRHGNGSGAQHQGCAGRRARARDQSRPRSLVGGRYEQGGEHVGNGCIDRQRPERQGGQDAARQIRQRLAEFAAATFGGSAADVAFAGDFVNVAGKSIAFPISCSKRIGRVSSSGPTASTRRPSCIGT